MTGSWLLPLAAAGLTLAPELPQANLDALCDAVERLVADDEVVGAELLVTLHGERKVHRAFGSRDRDAGERLEPGTIWSLRSMTKPMAGTVVQRLVDRGLLRLDARVSEYLPSFAEGRSSRITLEHLLTHLAGFDQGQPPTWSGSPSLRARVDGWGEDGPVREPGTTWVYADASADILGAVAAEVTGKSAGALLHEELLAPLELTDTIVLFGPDDPRNDRITSLYVGEAGSWRRSWRPEDGPFFEYTLWAQSVYSTASDYTRFLELWMRGGVLEDGTRLLSEEAVRRTFARREGLELPAGAHALYPEWKVDYGHLWALIVAPDDDPEELPFGFFHGGSDGTFAYAFPHLGLSVVLMTQCRGDNAVPVRFQSALRELLVDPLRDDA